MRLAAVLLFAASVAPAQQPTFTPLHSNGIYALGEKAGWTVTASPSAAKYTYKIKKNNGDTLRTGTLDLTTGTAALTTTLDEPAMLYVEVTTPDAPATPVHLGAAVAPERLKPSAPRPLDFDDFWNAKLKALAEIAIHPVLTPTPSNKPGVDLFTVTLDSLGSHVHGYLAKPSGEGKYPAMIVFQYAGVYALKPETVTDRAAEGWLAFDVDSHDLAPDQSTGVPKDYQAIGNTDRETSYFLPMYLRDARAVDYLASRSDWDGKTLVATGASMGGQQSLVVAALHPAITAVVVNEPAGADFDGSLHGRPAGYPFWPSDNAAAMKTGLYFDTVNFAQRINAPVLAAMGFIDTIAPPVGIWIALDQTAGPREAVPMIESDHNNKTPDKQTAYSTRTKEVFTTLLHGGKWTPDESLTRPK